MTDMFTKIISFTLERSIAKPTNPVTVKFNVKLEPPRFYAAAQMRAPTPIKEITMKLRDPKYVAEILLAAEAVAINSHAHFVPCDGKSSSISPFSRKNLHLSGDRIAVWFRRIVRYLNLYFKYEMHYFFHF